MASLRSPIPGPNWKLGCRGKRAVTSNDSWSLKEYRQPSSPERSYFRKNLSPSIPPGSASHPFVCYLTFGYRPKDSSGLPAAGVEDAFVRIEETEIPLLEEQELSVLVGVVIKGGVKDFIFYASDAEVFLARAAHPEFRLGCEVGPDPTWSHYAELP
jgi:hypothetical protein